MYENIAAFAALHKREMNCRCAREHLLFVGYIGCGDRGQHCWMIERSQIYVRSKISRHSSTGSGIPLLEKSSLNVSYGAYDVVNENSEQTINATGMQASPTAYADEGHAPLNVTFAYPSRGTLQFEYPLNRLASVIYTHVLRPPSQVPFEGYTVFYQ